MNQLVMIPIDMIHPHPDNPRKDLGDLNDLSASIKESGLLQNLTVIEGSYQTEEEFNAEWRDELDMFIEQESDIEFSPPQYDPHKATGAGFTVIIGHRRLAAARLAGLTEVPSVISDMDYKTQLATMMAENVQRSDLTPLEQANGFQLMMDLGMSVAEVADKTGFTTSLVRRRLKIAGLDIGLIKTDPAAISMKDLERVSQIKDKYARNSLMRELGTKYFDDHIDRAESAQRSRELEADIIKEIKTMRPDLIEATSGNIGRNMYCDYWLLRTFDYLKGIDKIPANATAFYVNVKNGGCTADVTFGGPNIRKEKENDPDYNAEKHRRFEINRMQWEAITAAARNAYERRFAFVRTKIHKHDKLIWTHNAALLSDAGVLIFRQLGYEQRRRYAAVLGADPDKHKYYEQNDAVKAASAGFDPVYLLTAAVYADMDPGCAAHVNDAGYNVASKPAVFEVNKKLCDVYEWLALIGYEESEEEKRMRSPNDKLYDIKYFEQLYDEQNAAKGGTD